MSALGTAEVQHNLSMVAMQAKADMAEAAVPVDAGKTRVWVRVSGSVKMR